MRFFSDYITGNISVTAGTLNITGTTHYYVNGNTTPVTVVPNFNPGDVVVAKTEVTNSGNKSAWVRSRVDLTGIDPDIADYIKVYAGENSAAGIVGPPALTPLATGNATTPVILNGYGANAETETGGVSTYTSAVTIYFDPAAPNKAQGIEVAVQILVEAIQYRNNPSPVWTTLELVP